MQAFVGNGRGGRDQRMLEGYGRSWVVVYHGYVAPVLPGSLSSFFLPGYPCFFPSSLSSFLRRLVSLLILPGKLLPPLRLPRKKLMVPPHTIGNLALCRFYSKTIALRTPVSFIFLLQIADIYIYARNQSHGGRTFQYALWWVCIRRGVLVSFCAHLDGM